MTALLYLTRSLLVTAAMTVPRGPPPPRGPSQGSQDPGESEPLALDAARPGSSGPSAYHAAVLQHLVRPRARRRARLAKPQQRRAPCRRPRPVTHMMPGIRAVHVPVAPLIAAIRPGELRAAGRAGLLDGGAECCGERIGCHPGDPLRCCRPCARPGGPCVAAAAPAAGCSRSDSLCAARARTAHAPGGR